MPDAHDTTWFITGAGRGLGRAFVEAALAAGHAVAATVRAPDALAELQGAAGDRLLVVALDVRDRSAVGGSVAAAVEHFGRLDVVVNNAGYGLVGTVEEVSEDEARGIIDTNLLGPLWVSQAAVPVFRRQGGGHLVQVSTVGAVGSMPTLGLYNASKWGLEGFSEALAAELAQIGARVTIAEFGGFNTDWAGTSMQFAAPRPEWDALREALFGTPVVPWEPQGDDAPSDDADPREAAAALIAHVTAPDGPLRLLVGEDAPVHVAMALERRRDDYERDARFTWPSPAP